MFFQTTHPYATIIYLEEGEQKASSGAFLESSTNAVVMGSYAALGKCHPTGGSPSFLLFGKEAFKHSTAFRAEVELLRTFTRGSSIEEGFLQCADEAFLPQVLGALLKLSPQPAAVPWAHPYLTDTLPADLPCVSSFDRPVAPQAAEFTLTGEACHLCALCLQRFFFPDCFKCVVHLVSSTFSPTADCVAPILTILQQPSRSYMVWFASTRRWNRRQRSSSVSMPWVVAPSCPTRSASSGPIFMGGSSGAVKVCLYPVFPKRNPPPP